MVVQGNPRDYSDRHPYGVDLGLVVEIVNTTLERDCPWHCAERNRTLKKSLYAEANIPCYWLVSLPERSVTVYSQPMVHEGRSDYQQQVVLTETEAVTVMIARQEWGAIVLSEILPKRKD